MVKGNLFLIHWNQAEAGEKAAYWRTRGWEVAFEAEDGARAGKAVIDFSPDVILIYLDRLPSHGRETAHYIHTRSATKQIPIVFSGGSGDALNKVKDKVPEGVFTSEEVLDEVLEGFVLGGE
jgi:DNA-binding response OmpR family regulator